MRLLTNTIIFVVLKIRKGSGPPTQPPCHTWRENILRFSHVSQKFIYLTTTYRQSVRVSDCALRSSLASATVWPRHPSSLQVETQAVGYALQLCPVSLEPEKTVHNSIIEMTLKLNFFWQCLYEINLIICLQVKPTFLFLFQNLFPQRPVVHLCKIWTKKSNYSIIRLTLNTELDTLWL